MTEFFDQLVSGTALERTFTVWEVVFNMGLAILLALLVTRTYIWTHRGPTYSSSFLHTVILMGAMVALIMMIIGSNVARAFSLVGALSIIRFRTAVKDARDTGFIFAAMAAGMACGTGFWLVAIIGTVFICLVMLTLNAFRYGYKDNIDKVLRLRMPAGSDYQEALTPCFKRFLDHWSLVNLSTAQAGLLLDLTFHVQLQRGANERNLVSALAEVNDNQQISLLFNDEHLNV